MSTTVRIRRSDYGPVVPVEIPDGPVYEIAIYGTRGEHGPYVRSEYAEATSAREARAAVALEPGETIEDVGVMASDEVAWVLMHGGTFAGKDPR